MNIYPKVLYQHRLSISIVFFLFLNTVTAQIISIKSETPIEDISKYSSEIKIKQNENPATVLFPIIEDLINDNYLEANIDSITSDTSGLSYTAYAHFGPRYDFNSILLDSLSQSFLKELKLSNPKTAEEYINLREQIKGYYANRGYPFCKVRLDNMKFRKSQILGDLKVVTGPLIVVDSINIVGDLKIKPHYLRRYLDMNGNDVYNHDKILSIPSQLEKLSFLKQTQAPDLKFFHTYSTLNLYLDKKNASRFDFLIGVIPTDNLGDQQLFLSFDFTAEMLNRLGYGEYIYLDFERLRPEQQKLEAKFNYPYLLDLPFGINAEFSIFRNALDYSTLKSDIGINYFINSNDNLKVSWDYESSSLIDIDTAMLYVTRSLPQDLDVNQTGVAVELNLSRLDYRFNPRSGYNVRLKAVAGQRNDPKKSCDLPTHR